MIEALIAVLPTLAPTVVGAVVDLIRGHPDTTEAQRARLDASFARADAADAAWEAVKTPVVADPPNAISGNE